MLPIAFNPQIPRKWLRPTGAGPHELCCKLVVDQKERWLRAIVLGPGRVLFQETQPMTNPSHWRPASLEAVGRAEKALQAEFRRAP
jgi:hypothetical protein